MALKLVGLLAALVGEVAHAQQTVVVTGTYEPLPLGESDRAVRSLDVRALPPLLANTVIDFLKLDASLDVRQRAPNNLQTDLSIRGGTFGQTLVLLNGLRLNDAQSGHHSMNLPVPLESVSRVEVLKGSGSTLYGADAVGGVVNFITQVPESSEVRLRAAVGNFGVNQQRLTATKAHRTWTQQLAVSRDFSTGFQPNRDYRNLSLASTTHVITPLGSTDLLLAHADRPFGADRFYGNFNSWERTKAWFASLRQNFGARTEAAVAFRRHTDLFVLYRDRPQAFTNRHATESVQASVRRWEPLAANAKLHYGAEAFTDGIESNNLGRHRRSRGAAYAALDVRAARRWAFSFGVRDELVASADHQWMPSATVGYWAASRLRMRASLSRAFRLPTFTDLYYSDPATRGDATLRPEHAWNAEVGLDWSPSDRLRAELTVFQRRERDGLDYVRRSPADFFRATNLQRLRFTGVEALVTASLPRRQQVDVSYTGLAGSQSALAPGVVSRYVFNYPRHQGVVGYLAPLPGQLLVRTRVGALQRLGRDPYAVWDVYAASSRGQWHPFVQVTNLTAARYEEILGVAMPGRGAVVGVEWVARGR